MIVPPDSLEYFEEEMLNKFNLNFDDFKKFGDYYEPNELTCQWQYKGYILEYCGDDPYYTLRKEE